MALSQSTCGTGDLIIDDGGEKWPLAANGSQWQLFSDQVMGGVSHGAMSREEVLDRSAIRMQGTVSLENNGGFIQIALDMAPGGGAIDASAFAGVVIDVTGNGETYGCHLRTLDSNRPWQSYRCAFQAGAAWDRVYLPFADFTPHRTDVPFDRKRLRRIGLVAIGREFTADLSVSRLALYRSGERFA